ncbi:hypothetical protein TRIATDRAFT_284547 [Trichoderma atroviride IMI 206040]|uniref:Uncharacterized protein n=1 Tax=Hypocrea atroviridis (strain ATCC 20476 / IMI 206040) TaxID=452589 RepID=G9NZ75_HYPAI|nr:uncharacterized protein TRIATDRAFT_284547 [Trichoderma atroviride IMI 206040]EHK43790.1 hypothetical protein TRIATDRAFT_284547 [Trichoderma atroviride IMI 206040]
MAFPQVTRLAVCLSPVSLLVTKLHRTTVLSPAYSIWGPGRYCSEQQSAGFRPCPCCQSSRILHAWAVARAMTTTWPKGRNDGKLHKQAGSSISSPKHAISSYIPRARGTSRIFRRPSRRASRRASIKRKGARRRALQLRKDFRLGLGRQTRWRLLNAWVDACQRREPPALALAPCTMYDAQPWLGRLSRLLREASHLPLFAGLSTPVFRRTTGHWAKEEASPVPGSSSLRQYTCRQGIIKPYLRYTDKNMHFSVHENMYPIALQSVPKIQHKRPSDD